MPTTATPAFRKTAESFAQGATTLPQRYFVSPEVFAQEQEAIFSRQWVLVGHQSQVERAGDFFVREVLPSQGSGTTGAGESLIIARDREGTLRGFYNVCRHRGTRLCEEASGHSATIQCPYHAWTYALDGKLVGAPHMDAVKNFAKGDYSLHPVKLAIWEGFIFVNLEKDSKPFEQVFAPLMGKFSHWNLPQLRLARRIEYNVRANWKLIFENYSECYHCPGVHPILSKVSPYDSAENDLTAGPFLGGFMAINKGKSLTMSGNACALGVAGKDQEKEQEHEQEGKDRVFYYSIFPNMLLSLHPDYVMVHQLWPHSPERT